MCHARPAPVWLMRTVLVWASWTHHWSWSLLFLLKLQQKSQFGHHQIHYFCSSMTLNHEIWNKFHSWAKLAVSSCWRPFHFAVEPIISNLCFYSAEWVILPASHHLNLASGYEMLPWTVKGREELGHSWGHPAGQGDLASLQLPGNLDILFSSHWADLCYVEIGSNLILSDLDYRYLRCVLLCSSAFQTKFNPSLSNPFYQLSVPCLAFVSGALLTDKMLSHFAPSWLFSISQHPFYFSLFF